MPRRDAGTVSKMKISSRHLRYCVEDHLHIHAGIWTPIAIVPLRCCLIIFIEIVRFCSSILNSPRQAAFSVIPLSFHMLIQFTVTPLTTKALDFNCLFMFMTMTIDDLEFRWSRLLGV